MKVGAEDKLFKEEGQARQAQQVYDTLDTVFNASCKKFSSFNYVPLSLQDISLVPFDRSQSTISISGHKLAKYRTSSLGNWRSLVMTSFTILGLWETWRDLMILGVLALVTAVIVVFSNSAKSLPSGTITNSFQFLMSFILASYVSIIVSRWDRLRNELLGALWGAVENINMCSHTLFTGTNEQELTLKNTVARYARSSMLTLFLAAKGSDDLSKLQDLALLSRAELAILNQAQPGVRPLVVVGWLAGLFDKAAKAGYYDYNINRQVIENLTQARAGIVNSLGLIDCQVPFSYAHIVYWIIQVTLILLAFQTGVDIAVMFDRRENGNAQYSYSGDDPPKWPQNPIMWYGNYVVQEIVGNVIFVLFTEGLLKMCSDLENPFGDENIDFPELSYDNYVHNNCDAVGVGFASFDALHGAIYPPASDLPQQPSPPSSSSIRYKGQNTASATSGARAGGEGTTVTGTGADASGGWVAGVTSAADDVKDGEARARGSPLREGVASPAVVRIGYGLARVAGGLPAERLGPGGRFISMSASDLAAYLRKKGDGLESYAAALESRGIGGRLFLTLTEEELRDDFNVEDKYHRRALLLLRDD